MSEVPLSEIVFKPAVPILFVLDVTALFEELKSRGVEFPQTPTTHPWGGTDFHVRDPDGNVISFVTFG